MWNFHWYWRDSEGKELTTTQTAVPVGDQVPVPPDVAGGTLTHVTLEPEEEPAVDPTEASESEAMTSSSPSETLPTEAGADVAAGLTP